VAPGTGILGVKKGTLLYNNNDNNILLFLLYHAPPVLPCSIFVVRATMETTISGFMELTPINTMDQGNK
jgi:hypothetical protein